MLNLQGLEIPRASRTLRTGSNQPRGLDCDRRLREYAQGGEVKKFNSDEDVLLHPDNHLDNHQGVLRRRRRTDKIISMRSKSRWV